MALVPPNNTAEPSIVGEAVEGRTLTANRGTWSGTTPMSFAYRWLRCPTDGGHLTAPTAPPSGARRGTAYRLRDADVGIRIRVRVTANERGRLRLGGVQPDGGRPGLCEADASSTSRRISGSPMLGATQTANPGTWSGTQPITFTYQWRSCNGGGGGCSNIAGATGEDLRDAELGHRQDAARPRDRSELDRHGAATSVPTAVINVAAPTGCPGGNGPVNITQLTPPARLLVDRFQVRRTRSRGRRTALTVGFRVTACGGRPVAGALVYVTAVPYNQFAIPPEAQTGGDGIAILRMARAKRFPAANNQTLLVMFVRARKGGEPALAGISTRRLISFRLAK